MARPSIRLRNAAAGFPAKPGIWPAQAIAHAVEAGVITSTAPLDARQIQPASLDLRLGSVAYRIRASFLPGSGHSVAQRMRPLVMHEVPLDNGAVLERGCIYLIPLVEGLALPPGVGAMANPKSSTGRIDVFVRLLTDGAASFDAVAEGYRGPLWAEVSPRTFSVLVRAGSRLNQLRIKQGRTALDDAELRRLHARTPLVHGGPPAIQGGLALTVALARAKGARGPLGWRARRHAALIDVDRVGHYRAQDFWEAVPDAPESALVLDPGEFYILASREAVTIPPAHAAEMVPFDPLFGEFRVHYAGFFDPGFGWAEAGGTGSRAVLEVRSHEVPFVLEDGQTIGRLVYERLAAEPPQVYGQGIGSNYQAQGLKLSKHFKAP